MQCGLKHLVYLFIGKQFLSDLTTAALSAVQQPSPTIQSPCWRQESVMSSHRFFLNAHRMDSYWTMMRYLLNLTESVLNNLSSKSLALPLSPVLIYCRMIFGIHFSPDVDIVEHRTGNNHTLCEFRIYGSHTQWATLCAIMKSCRAGQKCKFNILISQQHLYTDKLAIISNGR